MQWTSVLVHILQHESKKKEKKGKIHKTSAFSLISKVLLFFRRVFLSFMKDKESLHLYLLDVTLFLASSTQRASFCKFKDGILFWIYNTFLAWNCCHIHNERFLLLLLLANRWVSIYISWATPVFILISLMLRTKINFYLAFIKQHYKGSSLNSFVLYWNSCFCLYTHGLNIVQIYIFPNSDTQKHKETEQLLLFFLFVLQFDSLFYVALFSFLQSWL